MKYRILILLTVLFSTLFLQAEVTIGLKKHNQGTDDNACVLFAPMGSKDVYLIDKCGYVLHKWNTNYRPGFSAYLLENGNLLHTGYLKNELFSGAGSGGVIEILDWDGNVIWNYILNTPSLYTHHDVKILPNGNILAIVWDKKSKAEALKVGRKPELTDTCVWNEKIIEIKPIGKDSAEIVWEWSAWDHLVQDYDKSIPNFGKIKTEVSRIDINNVSNENKIDWLHINSVDFNEEYNQILLSSLYFNEIWIIDHSTTKEEAKTRVGGKYGKGGDILYRWGNPLVYGYTIGTKRELYYQHSASWVPKGVPSAGDIIIFNNKVNDGEQTYSSVLQIKPPVDSEGLYEQTLPYGPKNISWEYKAPNRKDFYSMNLSSAQKLPNGNVLICSGFNGRLFEVDTNKNILWEYINPVLPTGIAKQGILPNMNLVFKCINYSSNYKGLIDKDLSRKAIIEEKNENSENCELIITSTKDKNISNFKIYKNIYDANIVIETEEVEFIVEIYTIEGKLIVRENNLKVINTNELSSGVYYLIARNRNNYSNFKFVVER